MCCTPCFLFSGTSIPCDVCQSDMWKLVPHGCFVSHFPSYQGCRAFSYSNWTIMSLYVYILCPLFYFLFQKHWFTIYSFMWDRHAGVGYPTPSLAWTTRAFPHTSLSLYLPGHGSISLRSWTLSFKKEKKRKNRRQGEKSTSLHHIILFAICEACCCCTIHVGFIFQQPTSTA